MKNGIENDTKIKCDFEVHFLSIFVDFGSNLAAQIDQQMKKNCIKKGSDFKTKLYCRMTPIDPSSWSGAAPLGGPRDARPVFQRTIYGLGFEGSLIA